MSNRPSMVSLPWKLALVALFLLGMGIPLHEKLERRREERLALRHMFVRPAAAPAAAEEPPVRDTIPPDF